MSDSHIIHARGTVTHTVATLEVPRAVWNTIAEKLRAVGYDHVFSGEQMDMTGIALVPPKSALPEPKKL